MRTSAFVGHCPDEWPGFLQAQHTLLLNSTLGCLHVTLSWPVYPQLLHSFLPSFVSGDGPAVPAAALAAPGVDLAAPAKPLPDFLQPLHLRGDHRHDVVRGGGLPEQCYGLTQLQSRVSSALCLC